MNGENLGFIGIGQMGRFMALNLKKAGYNVHVFDVNEKAMEEIKEHGIATCPSPKDVAMSADDTIIVMVRNYKQVRDVLFGEDGIRESGRKNLDIIITSTTNPSFARELGEEATRAGYRMINAPVSGASHGAEKGTLSLMVSGDEALFKKSKPIFDAVGKKVFYFGPKQESGQGAKLGNNLAQGISMLGCLEAFRFATRMGISETDFRDLLSVSTGNSWGVQNWEWTRKLWKEKDDPEIRGLLALIYKDLNAALNESSLSLPMLGLAAQIYLLMQGLEDKS